MGKGIKTDYLCYLVFGPLLKDKEKAWFTTEITLFLLVPIHSNVAQHGAILEQCCSVLQWCDSCAILAP